MEEEIAAHCAPPKARNLSPLCTMWKVIFHEKLFAHYKRFILSVFLWLQKIHSTYACALSIPGEPPSYRSRRPRSTSEAASGVCRDDVRNTRSKDDHRTHPLNGSHNGADRVRTAACISPPHQEDDIDLCPPAAGIYSLDFDPMSFQCSPPSATPGLQHKKDGNKWRKSAGFSGESEPISSPNNNIRGYQSPDISPALGKGGKKVTSKPLSPKLRKKSFKTQADVQNATASPPPLPSSSPPVERCEARLADGKEPRAPYPHCSPLSTASQGSALTDLSQSAQNLPDPGQCHSINIIHNIYRI